MAKDTTSGSEYTFSCTRCGKCCREEGIVLFTKKEIRLAAELTGLSQDEFIGRYLSLTSDGYTHFVGKRSRCAFLTKNGCSINSVKPKQCRSFPYWNEYTDSRGKIVRFDRPCPGVKKIPLKKKTRKKSPLLQQKR
ncbi:MAG: YkgJ family cysteine cluster protein [Spirochaetota bacterium]